jgi:N-acetyl sugar amidotransferase
VLLERYRKGDGEPDVVVPCSGGKDSSFVAHVLKHRYGMTPLLVTWSPLMPTEIGKRNLDNLVSQGFHHLKGTFSPKSAGVATRLALKEIGYPFLPFVYGQFNFPLQVSVQRGIPLVFYGENGEIEYGGDTAAQNSPRRDIARDSRNLFSSLSPRAWVGAGLLPGEASMLDAPSPQALIANGTEVHWFGYYHQWDPQENFYYASEHVGFRANPERSEGTYSKYASLDDKVDGFHYYLSFIKFGHGRATYDTAQEIRAGKITREEGVALVRKFDGEFPSRYFEEFLAFTDLTEKEFWDFVDSWRSPHLWKKTESGFELQSQVS